MRYFTNHFTFITFANQTGKC